MTPQPATAKRRRRRGKDDNFSPGSDDRELSEVTLDVPQDPGAERVVVACAVTSERGTALAHQRLCEEDFYSPLMAGLFRVSLSLADLPTLDDRLNQAAASVGIDRRDLEALVREAPVMWDTSGSYARRVRDAASLRRVMAQLGQGYHELGKGAPLVAVVPLLEAALSAARGDRVGVLHEHRWPGR